jgi:hypothetical protein
MNVDAKMIPVQTTSGVEGGEEVEFKNEIFDILEEHV